MNTAEYVFAVIGILIVIGGFVYGIYDSYFQKEDSSSPDSESKEHHPTDAV